VLQAGIGTISQTREGEFTRKYLRIRFRPGVWVLLCYDDSSAQPRAGNGALAIHLRN